MSYKRTVRNNRYRRKRKSGRRQSIGHNMIYTSIITIVGLCMFVLICAIFAKSIKNNIQPPKEVVINEVNGDEVVQDFLTPNEYSRPQTPLKKVKGIVVHYTANPGTDAKANRDYFESLSVTHETHASSHYIIGLDGTVIQCIPTNEISYASNDRNKDTISIECCHKKKNGKFTKETYEALVKLVATLVKEFDVEKEDIIRHYDVTGKMCPKYYVEHEDLWVQFKEEVFAVK